jgi:hypothetical protein
LLSQDLRTTATEFSIGSSPGGTAALANDSCPSQCASVACSRPASGEIGCARLAPNVYWSNRSLVAPSSMNAEHLVNVMRRDGRWEQASSDAHLATPITCSSNSGPSLLMVLKRSTDATADQGSSMPKSGIIVHRIRFRCHLGVVSRMMTAVHNRMVQSAEYAVAEIAVALPVQVSELLCLLSGCQHRTIGHRTDMHVVARTTRTHNVPLRCADPARPCFMFGHRITVGASP